MQEWQIVIAAVMAAVAVWILVGGIVYFFCCCMCGRRSNLGPRRRRGVHRLHENSGNNDICNKIVHGQYSFSADGFSWDNHPSLVAETLEHGWTTFAFTYNYFNINDKNRGSALGWGFRARGEKEQTEPEITWEAVSGSKLMQKIRLNPGSASSKFMALQTALPLPGPPLGSLGFPQEAYFEITIISEESTDEELTSFEDAEVDDRVKLLQLVNLEGDAIGTGATDEGPRLSDIEPSNGKVSGKKRKRIIALGQCSSGAFSCTLPGLDAGSVGFYSTGAVLLNGKTMPRSAGYYASGATLLNGESPGDGEAGLYSWGAVGSIIGCGFDPETRCVYFTLNGVRVRSVTCKNQEFGGPLYPAIAANYDVTVLVNFGQRSFCYGTANPARLSDPSSLNCLEDSQEFFSMERIDPFWLADKVFWPDKNAASTPDAEESDMFEIVLERENLSSLS